MSTDGDVVGDDRCRECGVPIGKGYLCDSPECDCVEILDEEGSA